MTVTPSETDLQNMTPMDVRNANLIALLLLCAKTIQLAVLHCDPTTPEEKRHEAGKHVASFVYQLTFMYGDGHGLEADVLALAKKLGFNIEQRYLSKEAHA